MSRPLRVLSVFGTRPEAIKMAPVVRALEADPRCEGRVCVTAQHRGLLDQAMEAFGVRPHHDLGVMRPDQDLSDVTSAVLLGMREVLRAETPDVVLVHGDTTTALAATLAAFYAQIPVGHVEAGLRTGDLAAPWPEEANRVLVDRLCRYHFAPTERARASLLREGLPAERVWVTGNTVVDAVLWMRERVANQPLAWGDGFGTATAALAAPDAPVLLVTVHRRESFGGGFQRIGAALGQLAERFPEVAIVYPVHLNPNVQGPAQLRGLPNVHLLGPLDYPAFVWLMGRATLILTDSGGIQEEAPSLGTPVLVMRDTTERPEGVEAGTARLVGTDVDRIVREAGALLHDPVARARMCRSTNPFGDGRAASRIVEALVGAAASRRRR